MTRNVGEVTWQTEWLIQASRERSGRESAVTPAVIVLNLRERIVVGVISLTDAKVQIWAFVYVPATRNLSLINTRFLPSILEPRTSCLQRRGSEVYWHGQDWQGLTVSDCRECAAKARIWHVVSATPRAISAGLCCWMMRVKSEFQFWRVFPNSVETNGFVFSFGRVVAICSRHVLRCSVVFGIGGWSDYAAAWPSTDRSRWRAKPCTDFSV